MSFKTVKMNTDLPLDVHAGVAFTDVCGPKEEETTPLAIFDKPGINHL